MTKKQLTKSIEKVELLLKSTGEAIYGVGQQGNCTFANIELLHQLGYEEQELLGKNPHSLFQSTLPCGSNYAWEDSLTYRCLNQGIGLKGSQELFWRKDGTSFPTLLSVEPILERNKVTGAVVIFRDITQEAAVSNMLYHLARHDSLTGLINRREFEERLARVLESAKNDESEHILCYLDLDQFMVINDTLTRLGGDEFSVLMEHRDMNEGKRVANIM